MSHRATPFRFSKTLLFAVLPALIGLSFTGTAVAKGHSVQKYRFTDVAIGEDLVTIYASLKSVRKLDFTHCDYAAEDGAYLGYVEMPTDNVSSMGEVLDFCVDNYDLRQ